MGASPRARGLLDRFAAQIRRTLRAPEPDQVHDLRVAIRRLTQALAIVDPESKATGEIRRAVKRIMTLAGQVRDCDITLTIVAKAKAPRGLEARVERRRERALRRLLKEIGAWTDAHTGGLWRKQLVALHDGSESGTDVVARALKRLYKRGAAAEESDRELHRLRIAAKKLRYTLEFDDRDAAGIKQIKELQSRLGDVNDFETARRVAAQESASPRLLDRLEKKQERKIVSFRRFWDRQFAGRKRKWKAALR